MPFETAANEKTMNIDIAAAIKRIGIIMDRRGEWSYNGKLISQYGGRVLQRYHCLIIGDPEMGKILAPLIKKFASFGFAHIDNIKLHDVISGGIDVEIGFIDAGYCWRVNAYIADTTIDINILNEGDGKSIQTIDDQRQDPGIFWALTYLRGEYSKLFHTLLPQPIAEEVDTEFAFFCMSEKPRGCRRAA